GVPATIDSQVAASPVFASIVNDTSPLVAAIFTGHTHQPYAWDGTVPGQPGVTRPVVQTGSYGDRLADVTLTIDRATHAVTAHTEQLVSRTTTPAASLVATYPRVAAVNTIVNTALANAAVIGNQVVGSTTAPITTAFAGGSYGPGGYTGGTRDDR